MKKDSYDIKNLNRNIKTAMKKENVTQQQLGDHLDMEQTHISTMLRDDPDGKMPDPKIDIDKLVKIASFLNVSTDELLGLEEIKRPDEEITLADVFQKLFELESLVEFDIKETDEENHTFAITFKEEAISDELEVWSQLKNLKLNDDRKNQTIRTWKKDLLERGTGYTKASKFKYSSNAEAIADTFKRMAKRKSAQKEK